jgi:hypothetical protein
MSDQTIVDLVQGHRVTAIIYAAAKLNLAEAMGREARSPIELAPIVSAEVASLKRLLIALATIGVCAPEGEHFRLTELGQQLDSGATPSFKDYVLYEGEFHARGWLTLLDSVRTGKNAAELRDEGNDLFAAMGSSPRIVQVFNAAMASLTSNLLPRILANLDLSTARVVMDVGGGSGELIAGIVMANPQVRGIAFDLARCEEDARLRFKRLDIAQRCGFIAGDFFKAIPEDADTIVMKDVIHDWRDDRAAIILQNAFTALPLAGRLVLVERLMPEVPTTSPFDRAVALTDLNMLRGPGGCERKESEYRNLVEKAGYSFVSTARAGLFSLMQFKKGDRAPDPPRT